MAQRSATLSPPVVATILVVDDLSVARRGTTRVLAHEGYRVLEAASAADALVAVRAAPEPIDLVITDVFMPGGTGIELAQQLLAERPGLHLLIISGCAPGALARLGLEVPNTRFLAKPFTREELLRAVSDVIGRPA